MIETKDFNKELNDIRIAKAISRSGFCSRRDAEKLIFQKSVSVNNIIVNDPATKVNLEKDIIKINDEVLKKVEKTRLWLYNKPLNLVCSNKDEKNRKTIFDDLKGRVPRVLSIGRLDINSEGLLLLTNNGDLARYFELPKNALSRIYKVRIYGKLSTNKIQQLNDGITIDGIKYGKIIVEKENNKIDNNSSNNWVKVTLTEGKNREIRKVFNHLKISVSRLIRIQYGAYKLNNLKKGEIQEIELNNSSKQITSLIKTKNKKNKGWAIAKKKTNFKKIKRSCE